MPENPDLTPTLSPPSADPYVSPFSPSVPNPTWVAEQIQALTAIVDNFAALFTPTIVASYAYPLDGLVTPDCSICTIVEVASLEGPLAIDNPLGTPIDGQMLSFRFTQDSAGNRLITFGSDFHFGTDITTALIPTDPDASWEMLFRWHAATSRWRAMSIVRGF